MKDIKSKVQNLNPSVRALDMNELVSKTSNVYEALCVIASRAKQLNVDIKHELYQKLDEFAADTDAIEEIHENKEQIEISKFYERLPNPVIIAMDEYFNEELHHRYTGRKREYED